MDVSLTEKAKESAYELVRAESVKSNIYLFDYSMLAQCIAEFDIAFERVPQKIGK